jgi:hypothetical protein
MNELEINTIESSELIEQTFKFWYGDNEHIRSPFPNYIQPQLKEIAVERFFEWTTSLKPEAKDELNEEMIGEKFEEIIFEAAIPLIKTNDEKISILYPFLPRLGDKIENPSKPDSLVIDRSIEKDGDFKYLKLRLEETESKKNWETKFELPL